MCEILAPAGNAACAEAAIGSGADAIYLGYSAFSARAGAENFDSDALKEILLKAHFSGVKVYVAMNTLVKDGETEEFIKTLLSVWNEGADAIILQDLFLGKYLHERYPEIILHLSTQAGVCDEDGAVLAKRFGFSRVILARETPFGQIEKIAKIIETEVFVQGALCTCFSGQCYFSSFAGGNSGNRGRCKQPCRKLYSYDRSGFSEKSYALSLSDLCVGEYVEKFRKIGVFSFKIEGRMRRAEYVAAAVGYYRAILDGASPQTLSDRLSALRRAYNRGNYTKGLAFGQDKRLLSRDVQGHLGEKVGVVKPIDGRYFVESSFRPASGDAFKILRGGREAGGALFDGSDRRGFYIRSKSRLFAGDGVFVTTDTASNGRVTSEKTLRRIALRLTFKEGERARAVCRWEGGSVSVVSDFVLPRAEKRRLTEEEIEECFLKVDALPVSVSFDGLEVSGEIFLAKSLLNAFRRTVYGKMTEALTKNENERYVFSGLSDSSGGCDRNAPGGTNGNSVAVIAENFPENADGKIDVAVYKPHDYSAAPPETFSEGQFRKYIYYPAFATEGTVGRIAELIRLTGAEGIYAENYGGLVFAEREKVKVFAGTGFNLTNAIAVSVLLACPEVSFYAVSKELDEREQEALAGERAFVLSSGGIKLMDLCYCPFGKSCASCDGRNFYSLTDESGRAFPVRRTLSGEGDCRFEIYNCARLVGTGVKTAGKLLDCSLETDAEAIKRAVAVSDDAESQKLFYGAYTSGHTKKSVF